MDIKERKIRKVGNSLNIALSKEFLESIGAGEGDKILVDESKLAEAIVKVDDSRDLARRVDMIVRQSLVENAEVYRNLTER